MGAAASNSDERPSQAFETTARWDLYRVLAEPIRLRLLALASFEELSIGELAQLTGESQPNVSRHIASLRQVGLVTGTKHGTRSMVRMHPGVADDAIVRDAVTSGMQLCQADGSAARIAIVIAERDAAAREYFARPVEVSEFAPPVESAAYLTALSHLLPHRGLAIDIGTGDGGLLEILAPCFDRVIAIDRSEAQLALARARVAARGFANVELGVSDLSETSHRGLPRGKADAVFAVRVLHHAAVPRKLMKQLWHYCAPGGALVLIDYHAHGDESMRAQADVWLGFSPDELRELAAQAGFVDVCVAGAPAPKTGPDAHLAWQIMVAKRPAGGAA
ncbi:MAG: metalloregulator ArsR/SmtB family transcription factor [Myxococcales bacterium]|nr:metalloregulator ArsR/SmtB family transcription factor [Myxococcales bacterium]